jgi:hypothetical protein
VRDRESILGFEVCQQVRQIVADDAVYPYVDAPTQATIESWRPRPHQ